MVLWLYLLVPVWYTTLGRDVRIELTGAAHLLRYTQNGFAETPWAICVYNRGLSKMLVPLGHSDFLEDPLIKR